MHKKAGKKGVGKMPDVQKIDEDRLLLISKC